MTVEEQSSTLLGIGTSRCNKMHLAGGWGVEWRWQGEGPLPTGLMRSRMEFLINGLWKEARSWDEDVRPTFKDRGSIRCILIHLG